MEKKNSGSGLEIREYSRRDPSRWPRGTLYQKKLALASPTSGGRSIGIVRSRTQVTVFVLFVCLLVPFRTQKSIDQNPSTDNSWDSQGIDYCGKGLNRVRAPLPPTPHL
jgi:hypothetical protein